MADDRLRQLHSLHIEINIRSSTTKGDTLASIYNRTLIGHPFNPPHLVPLVEIVGGRLTDVR